MLCFMDLGDVSLQDIILHFEILAGGKKFFLFKIEAVFAIEVANRPDRLGHHMEAVGNRRGTLGR